VLLGFNAAVEDNLVSRPSHHDHEEEHDHDEDINSVQFCLDSPVDAQILTQRIKELVAWKKSIGSRDLLTSPINRCVWCYRESAIALILSSIDPGNPRKLRQTRLVFIGRSLDSQRIEAGPN
jgi:cobalamin biosynthesis protein CobW